MPKWVRRKITKRLVVALAREGKSGVYWDAALGRHVDLTPAQARESTCLQGLGSRFETAVAGICRANNSERKAIGSELRTMPSRGTERVLAQ